jgi:hypothetical protein
MTLLDQHRDDQLAHPRWQRLLDTLTAYAENAAEIHKHKESWAARDSYRDGYDPVGDRIYEEERSRAYDLKLALDDYIDGRIGEYLYEREQD